jgi:hypothetical protein
MRTHPAVAARSSRQCGSYSSVSPLAILAANADDRGYDSGYEVLDLTTKSDKRNGFVLPAVAVDAVGRYLDGRTTGPLFQTRTGGRLDEPAVFRLIQRVATAAGIPQAATLSPYSMRHTVATIQFLKRPGTAHRPGPPRPRGLPDHAPLRPGPREPGPVPGERHGRDDHGGDEPAGARPVS